MAHKTAKKAVNKAANRVATPPAGKAGNRAAKRTPPSAKKQVGREEVESLTHRLEALLHTMRCIAQHEDELCGLLHDARRTSRISRTLLRELQSVLRELPAEEYTDDLHAVRDLTDAA